MNKFQWISFIIVIIFFISLTAFIVGVKSPPIDSEPDIPEPNGETNITLELFISSGFCASCEQAKDLINNEIEPVYGDNITIVKYPVDRFDYKDNWDKWQNYGFKTYPSIVIINYTIGTEYNTYLNYSDLIESGALVGALEYHINGNYSQDFQQNKSKLESGCLNIQGMKLCPSDMSLPILTIILGGLDSVNPCSFFVLLFLLSLLLFTKSRKRMVLIGGIFIFFSGLIYFLIMVLISNAISLIEQQIIIATLAGVVAIIFGILNIKDFFWFKKGISASIPEKRKAGLYKQMRKIIKISSIPSVIGATVLFALSANTVELVCSIQLPLIYTGTILPLYNLGATEQILYILFYNVIYVIPLLFIVGVVVATLGRWKLSEFQGRVLKLFSGIMIFSIGEILLINFSILENIFVTFGILIMAIVTTAIIVIIWKGGEKRKTLNIDHIKTWDN